ncbi:MAG: LysM peptidoglycan-binding domain-containing protein [Bacteroides sp.]
MKATRRFVLFLIVISASFFCKAQENQSYFLHTIEKGQSLYSISNMYDVTTSDIIRLNPGCEEKIYSGQTIKIPRKKVNLNGETFHTIQSGETLYRLTTIYKVSAKTICEANPGLSADNFRIGQVIRIPLNQSNTDTTVVSEGIKNNIQGPVQSKCKEMHRVSRKETIFSVSRQYGITQDELIKANPELKNGIKKGQLLCIPYPTAKSNGEATKDLLPPTNTELFSQNKVAPKSLSTVKTALLLPFTEDRRMVEYYEGFLIAVDSLKQMGISIDLHVYDCAKDQTSLQSILAKEELKKMDLIIGPAQSQHIKPLAEFTKANNIRLVIPFSSKVNEVFNYPNLYQINTPQSYLYSEVYEHFIRQFSNAHVIFIHPSQVDKDKEEFIKGLKAELRRNKISIENVSETATTDILKNAIRADKQNIFIPTSGNNIILIKTLPQLTLLVREFPEMNIHLFGYPEWQTYTKDHLETFFDLDTYFYSSFYTNNLFPAAIHFTKAYHKWYSKDMLPNCYPQYAMLGFDTGFFFIKGLNRFGSTFESNLNRVDVTPIQTGFNFERVNNWGGFVNKKAFFVRFTRNYELVKLDFE